MSVYLSLDVTHKRARRDGGCDWYNVDVMDYLQRSEYIDSHRIGTFLVEGQVGRVVVNGKSRISVCRAWNMRMSQ